MTENKSDEKDKFEPVTTAAAVHGFLNESARSMAKVSLWTKNKSQFLSGTFSSFALQSQSFHIQPPEEFDIRDFAKALAELGTKEVFFNIFLPTANLFFVAQFEMQEKGFLKFEVPKTLYKVQRRDNFRYRLPVAGTDALLIEFAKIDEPGNWIPKRMFDISAGGVGFLLKLADKEILQDGVEIDLKFRIRNREIRAVGQVRYKTEIWLNQKTPAVKVGVMFTKIHAADQQLVASFAFEESCKRMQ